MAMSRSLATLANTLARSSNLRPQDVTLTAACDRVALREAWSRANGARHELARRLVGGDDHAGVADAALHELPRGGTRALGEQSLAGADGHGMRPDVHAVDELFPKQRLDQGAAAPDDHVRAILRLQPAERGGDVARDHARVHPVGLAPGDCAASQDRLLRSVQVRR